LILAVIFLGVAGYLSLESYHILSTYDRAPGHLVKREFVRTGKSVSCIGTITFVVKGVTYSAQIGGARSMSLGERIYVLYERGSPNNNRADATSTLWGYPLAAGGIGSVLLLIGLCAPGGPARTSTRRPPADPPSPSLSAAFAVPGATRLRTAPLQAPPVYWEEAPRGRSGLVRVFFGGVWVVVFLFVSVVAAAMIATWGAGDDPELQKQAAQKAGETVGPWVMLGAITLSVVLGSLGLLPGTGRKKR
jgi:hypothetical protein